MKKVKNDQMIANHAINRLKLGIKKRDRIMILDAFAMVENTSFDWDDVDAETWEEWDELVDEANDIIL